MDKCHVCGGSSGDLWTFDGYRVAHPMCEISEISRKINADMDKINKALGLTKPSPNAKVRPR